MRQKNEKEETALKEADELVMALGKRWEATGIVLMVAFAESTGNPNRPFEVEISMINVAGGSEAFRDHLPHLLRRSAESAEKDRKPLLHGRQELEDDKPGDFPSFLTDLLGKKKPGTN